MADKDKRNTQMSLPLELPKKNGAEVIKQHWKITFAKQKKTSVVAKRMWDNILAQIQEDDYTMKPYYQMQAHEVVKSIDGKTGGSAYSQCKKAFEEMASTVWMIEDIDSKYFAPRNLLDTTKTKKRDGFESNYDGGLITIAPNPALEPYFLEIAHWSKYERKVLAEMSSWYSMRMWEILSAWEDILQKGQKWYADIEEFRGWMDCEKKYKDVNLMIEKTLSEPLKELKETRLAFNFDKVYAKKGRGRPSVVGLDFYLMDPQGLKPASQKLNEWAEKSTEFKKALDKGREWKISDENLFKCLPVLKKDVWKLYKSFAEKQGSNDRMNSIPAFCNGAILIAAGFKEPSKAELKLNKNA